MTAVSALLFLVITLTVASAERTGSSPLAFADCPELLITCPDEVPETGKICVVKLRVEGVNPTTKLSYKTSVSSGEIVDGQGTSTLKVRFTEPEKSLTATVAVAGLPNDCGNTTSCTFVVS